MQYHDNPVFLVFLEILGCIVSCNLTFIRLGPMDFISVAVVFKSVVNS